MKKAFIFLFLCFSLVVFAEKYQVKVSSLNVRSKASKYGNVIGRLQKGDVINVERFSNKWGKIYTQRYGYGWVYTSSKFVTKMQEYKKPTPAPARSYSIFSYFWQYEIFFYFLFVSLALSVVLYILSLFRKTTPMEGKMYIANLVLLIASSVSILLYQFGFDNFTWFMKTHSWLMKILFFVLFGLFTYNQFNVFINTLNDILWNNAIDMPYKWGLLGFPISFVLYFILGYFSPEYTNIAFVVFALFVIYQSVLIFKRFNVLRGLLFLAVFLLGGFATSILLVYFIEMLIWVALIALGLYVVLGVLSAGGSSSSNSSSSSSSDNYNYSSNEEEGLYTENEYGQKVKLTENFGGTFQGDDGNTYERSSPFSDEVRKR